VGWCAISGGNSVAIGTTWCQVLISNRNATGAAAYEEAATAFGRARQGAPDYPDAVALLAYVYGSMGRGDAAREAARELDALARTRYVSPYSRAIVHVAFGEHARALSALEQAYAERSWLIAMLNVDPAFDALRGEAQFEALRRQLGFAGATDPHERWVSGDGSPRLGGTAAR
jgi:tetratricopeptide (TPR) repeat protein